jgi:hypothetical protein
VTAAEPSEHRTGIAAAAAYGFLAFVGTTLAGQLVGFLAWLAGARAYGARLPLKLGWLYLASFHRVGIDLTLTEPFGFGDGPEASPAGPATYTLRIAMLSGTIVAIALLAYAGRRAARRAPGSPWVVPGIALAYAAPIFVMSLLVTLRFPGAGVVGIGPVAWEAFALPALLALVASAVGVLSITSFGAARVRSWLRTGARMFGAAVLLAFVGFVVLAGVRPDASGSYLRWIGRSGSAGALVATNHLLLLPDQSLWILAPAMGSCDELGGASPSQRTELCGRSLGERRGPGDALANFFAFPTEPTTLPAPYLLFVLVPAGAVVAGAARSSTAGSLGARIADGAASGVVFAVLVVAGSLVSRVSIDQAGAGTLLSAGPEPVRTGLLALAWGVLGGAIGAGVFPALPQEGVVAPGAAVPAPPSPTSV